MMRGLSSLLLIFAVAYADEDSHDSHAGGHGDEEGGLAYAAAFELKPGTFTFTLSKVGGAYAESSVLLAVLPAGAEADHADAIEGLEDHAKEIFDGDEGSEVEVSGGSFVQ